MRLFYSLLAVVPLALRYEGSAVEGSLFACPSISTVREYIKSLQRLEPEAHNYFWLIRYRSAWPLTRAYTTVERSRE